MEGEVEIKCSNLREYIQYCLTLENIFLPHGLTDRELEFYGITSEMILQEITDPNSVSAQQRYKELFKKGIKSSEIHTYIKRICNKGLLTYDKNDRRLRDRRSDQWGRYGKQGTVIIVHIS